VRKSNKLSKHARSLRKNSTEAERLLWIQLRGRRLEGYKFRRQLVIEPYIVDFVCIEAKLIIEADGGQHAEQEDYDTNRSARLEALGYRVLRFWNHEILNDTQAVLDRIRQALISPHPVPQGEGTI
jgi:very-short-patch-repair endonuclease